MIQVLQKGYRLGDHVLRPARVVVSSGPPAARAERSIAAAWRVVLRDARRPQERVRRRAEEGVPQARAASTTPTGTPATRRRSGSSRRCRRPTTCSPTRRSARQYDTFGSTNGRPGPTNVDFGDFDLGDIFGGLFGGGGRGRGGGSRRSAASAARTSRSRCAISFEDSLKGLQTTVPVTLELACHTCHGTGAAPGTAPEALPELRGQRRRRDLAGALRPPAAVPGLPRQRDDRRHAVPDLPRLRPRAADEALHGADPRRRQGRHEDQAEGQGRGRLGRSSRGRPVRRHAGRAVEALRAARRRPRARRAGHVLRGRAGRDGRDPDARGPRVAQGAGGLAGREAAARQGPRRAEAERLRPAATCSPGCGSACRRSCRRPSARRSRASTRPRRPTRARGCSDEHGSGGFEPARGRAT